MTIPSCKPYIPEVEKAQKGVEEIFHGYLNCIAGGNKFGRERYSKALDKAIADFKRTVKIENRKAESERTHRR